MRIGITVWDDQISPLLDTATQLMLAETADGSVLSEQIIRLPQSTPLQRVTLIRDTGLSTLICGAISREYDTLLHSCSIDVISWVRGRVSEVVEAFLLGVLSQSDYRLPGRMCKRRRCGGNRRRRKYEIPKSKFSFVEEI